jgi:hypothetical protein
MSKKSFKIKHLSMDILQSNKNKPLYEVPDHYFEQLQHNVMQRVAVEEKRRGFYKKWISAVSIAASITLIFILSYFIFVNRNLDEHFYVFEELIQQDDTVNSKNINQLAENIETSINLNEPLEKLSPNTSLEPDETIVYRAVDFYVDDYETNNFCEVMYDLECYYDY